MHRPYPGHHGKLHDTLIISRTGSTRPLQIKFYPVRSDLVATGAAAIIYIHDPDDAPVIVEDALRTIFRLTRAEAKLAAALATGTNVGEFAELHSQSVHTTRTHLRRILSKSGARTQADLVRMVLSSAATLPRS